MNQRQKNKYLKDFVLRYWCNPNETIRDAVHSGVSWCDRKSINRFIDKYIFEPDKAQPNGIVISNSSKLKYKL